MAVVYVWEFKEIPSPAQVERFLERQMSLFARYRNYLSGSDGLPLVDIFRVEHNCGVVNNEVQFNGIPGHDGDVFCFPGYFPGDTDDRGRPLFNVCDTKGYFYGQIISFILDRAKSEFNIEVTYSVKRIQERYQIP